MVQQHINQIIKAHKVLLLVVAVFFIYNANAQCSIERANRQNKNPKPAVSKEQASQWIVQ